MLRIDGRFNATTVETMSQGELMMISYAGSAARAIHVGRTSLGEVHVVVLRCEAEELKDRKPFWDTIDPDEHALSFGTKWTLERLLTRQSYPGGGDVMKPGVIAVELNRNTMRVDGPPGQYGRPGRFDIDNLKLVDVSPGSKATPIEHWRLWLSGDGPDKPNAEPFYTFRT